MLGSLLAPFHSTQVWRPPVLKHAHRARSPGRRCSGPFHGALETPRRQCPSVDREAECAPGHTQGRAPLSRNGLLGVGVGCEAGPAGALPHAPRQDPLPQPRAPPPLRSSLIWGRGAPARPVLPSSQWTQAAQPSPLAPSHQPQRHPTGSRVETFRPQQIHPESEAPPTPAAAALGLVTSVPRILPAAPRLLSRGHS